MKYAFVNGKKVEATKGARGLCRVCDSEVIAYCGEVYVHHWKHKGNRNCDRWWENETIWHRTWKSNFPKEWQEIIHLDENSGEKHIADVKTDSNWVLEFQRSYISYDERQSRTAFYQKLIWVIDGARRKRDMPNFFRILDEFEIRSDDPRFKAIIAPDDCKLIKEWHDCDALVFFDFGDGDVWYLFPKIEENEAHLFPMSRQYFIELHTSGKFGELFEKTILPFIKKLIEDNKKRIAQESFRKREMERAIKARRDILLYGKKIIRH